MKSEQATPDVPTIVPIKIIRFMPNRTENRPEI